jgi:CO/xanthine dehydrogenase FAD-binding subunit
VITAYHRPASLEEALALITRASPLTLPLGGGTLLSHGQDEAAEVVDLQALGLNKIHKRGNVLEVGATCTLQALLDHEDCPKDLRAALRLEAPLNLRNVASVAGTLVTCDGRSALATALLALDAQVTIMRPDTEKTSLGEFLPLRRPVTNRYLMTALEINLGVRLAFEYVARTPADKPIVAAALAQWPSGRTRLALGGYGSAPVLAMDGTEPAGLAEAARNAYEEASDPWGSAEYRSEIAAALSGRCLARIGG